MRLPLAGRILLLAAGLALSTSTGRGLPPDVRVEGGDTAVNGSFFHPYTNTWKFTLQKPGSEPVEAGVWTDKMEIVTAGGTRAMKRTQVAQYKKGVRLTFVNVFDPKTMASMTFDYTRSDTGETRHLQFQDKTARFRRTPGTGDQPAQDYTATLDHRILDFYDGLYGILLDAFPLERGYAATFPAFDTDRAAIDWVKLKVSGNETVIGPSGQSFQAWVVRVDSSQYASSTWWLTREAPYVLKAVLVTPDREGGVTITYTMI